MLNPASTAVLTQSQFTTSVDLVAMDVCATDRSGRPAHIDPDALMVFDNGTRQQIALFSPGDRLPLAVTLLIDGSRSMNHGLLDQATAAATALIDQLPDDSLVEVMSFNDRAAVLYPMGADRHAAALTLSDLAPTGGTSLYEAVLVAIRRQQHAERTRHGTYREVIVVLTDGETRGAASISMSSWTRRDAAGFSSTRSCFLRTMRLTAGRRGG